MLPMLQAWQLKLVPVEDAPTKGMDRLGAKPTSAQQPPAKEYGCDLAFKLPAPDRSADDVVLALCAGPGPNGAAPADTRSYPSSNAHLVADNMFCISKRFHGRLHLAPTEYVSAGNMCGIPTGHMQVVSACMSPVHVSFHNRDLASHLPILCSHLKHIIPTYQHMLSSERRQLSCHGKTLQMYISGWV